MLQVIIVFIVIIFIIVCVIVSGDGVVFTVSCRDEFLNRVTDSRGLFVQVTVRRLNNDILYHCKWSDSSSGVFPGAFDGPLVSNSDEEQFLVDVEVLRENEIESGGRQKTTHVQGRLYNRYLY